MTDNTDLDMLVAELGTSFRCSHCGKQVKTEVGSCLLIDDYSGERRKLCRPCATVWFGANPGWVREEDEDRIH
jgi:hypothetical protein